MDIAKGLNELRGHILSSRFSPMRNLSGPVLTLGLLTITFCENQALANIAITGGLGGVIGQIAKGDSLLKSTGYAYHFAANWHPELGGKPSFFSLGLTGKQMKISYQEDHINKKGTYNLVGPSLGLFMPVDETFIVQVFAQYYPGSTFSTLSTNTVQLNGSRFKYSTWELFTGGGAFEGRINFTHDKIDGQFNRKNRFRSGVGVSYLQQNFTQEHTEIRTSKDSLTPTKTSTVGRVEYRSMLITIDYFLGLTF
jgi:hypothetical protein